MYHILDDIRAHKSAELIFQAYYECSYHKKLEDITVTDISKISSVSRSTFYRLFDNTADLLDYGLAMFIDSMDDCLKNHPLSDKKNLFLNLFEIHKKHHHFLEIVINHNLVLYMLKLKHHLQESIYQYYNHSVRMDDKKSEYFATSMAMLTLSTIITWIKRGRKETSEELYNLMLEFQSFTNNCPN